MRVLIVDDSVVYRSKIRATLSREPWIEVVGAASNGKLAIEMTQQKSVDLIILDMEMPVLDGLQTLKQLRASGFKAKIIVFSSYTVRGSEATLDALGSGADDFVTKPIAEANSEASVEDIIGRDLLPKIKQFYREGAQQAPTPKPETRGVATPERDLYEKKHLDTFRPSVIVIASSTGGPAAHEVIFRGIKGDLRCPILIAQHMPPLFTTAFAKRIFDFSGIPCHEAKQKDPLKNEIYVAPGDYHLTLKQEEGTVYTCLDKMPPRNSVRPAADSLFETAADIYGDKCMGFILTGMGEDGLIGAKAIKARRGGIMIQDQESCVVFGMPGAVFAAKCFDSIGSLLEIQSFLKRMGIK